MKSLKIMRRLIIGVTLAVACAWASAVTADISAKVIKPESRAPGASQYIIEIRGLEVTREIGRDASRYVVRDEDDNPVNVDGSAVVGFGPRYEIVQVYGGFEANKAYKLTLQLTGASIAVDVAKLEEQVSDDPPFVQYAGEHARFEIEPMIGDDASGFGAKFNTGVDLGTFGDIGLTGDLGIEGEISSDSDDTDFSRTIKGDLEFQYFVDSLRLPSPVTGDTRAYPIGLRFAPAGFEADQEFDLVDYKATAQIAFGVPYTDIPGQWITQAFGASKDFVPMFLMTGYSYVNDVNEKDGVRTFDVTNRWDTEISWALPLSDKTELELRYKHYLDIEDSDSEDRFLGVLSYEVGEGRAITLSYKDGGDAPTFNDDQAVRIGFDIKLGKEKSKPTDSK